MTEICEWCNDIFDEWSQLHHHVYHGLCSKDPYPEMRKSTGAKLVYNQIKETYDKFN